MQSYKIGVEINTTRIYHITAKNPLKAEEKAIRTAKSDQENYCGALAIDVEQDYDAYCMD